MKNLIFIFILCLFCSFVNSQSTNKPTLNPITYVSDNNDPKLKSYFDSLTIYNSWVKRNNYLVTKTRQVTKQAFGKQVYFTKLTELVDKNLATLQKDGAYVYNNQTLSETILPKGTMVFKIVTPPAPGECSCQGNHIEEVTVIDYSNANPVNPVVYRTTIKSKPVISNTPKTENKTTITSIKPMVNKVDTNNRKNNFSTGIGISFRSANENSVFMDKPVFTTIDKTTKFFTNDSGKTKKPYLEKTFYDTNNKPFRTQYIDPGTHLVVQK